MRHVGTKLSSSSSSVSASTPSFARSAKRSRRRGASVTPARAGVAAQAQSPLCRALQLAPCLGVPALVPAVACTRRRLQRRNRGCRGRGVAPAARPPRIDVPSRNRGAWRRSLAAVAADHRTRVRAPLHSVRLCGMSDVCGACRHIVTPVTQPGWCNKNSLCVVANEFTAPVAASVPESSPCRPGRRGWHR